MLGKYLRAEISEIFSTSLSKKGTFGYVQATLIKYSFFLNLCRRSIKLKLAKCFGGYTLETAPCNVMGVKACQPTCCSCRGQVSHIQRVNAKMLLTSLLLLPHLCGHWPLPFGAGEGSLPQSAGE